MNLLFSFRLAKLFENTNHASIAFHPGLVKSRLLKESPPLLRAFMGLVSSNPKKTADAVYSIIMEGDSKQQNGKFYNKHKKEMKAANYAYDSKIQDKLWKLSEEMVATS